MWTHPGISGDVAERQGWELKRLVSFTKNRLVNRPNRPRDPMIREFLKEIGVEWPELESEAEGEDQEDSEEEEDESEEETDEEEEEETEDIVPKTLEARGEGGRADKGGGSHLLLYLRVVCVFHIVRSCGMAYFPLQVMELCRLRAETRQ